MKNILTVLLVLFVPIIVYILMINANSGESAAAKDNGLPSVIAFTSTMCLDCQRMKTVMNEVKPDYEGKINFVHINALEKKRSVKDSISKYKVVLAPTLVFVDSNNNEVDKVEGFIPKEELVSKLERLLNE